METQSAFMGAAGAAVLVLAVLVRRRERAALPLAALTCAFGLWALGRGAATLGLEWGIRLGVVALAALGPLAVLLAATLAGSRTALRRSAPLLALGTLLIVAVELTARGHERWLDWVAVGWGLGGCVAGAVWLRRHRPDAAAVGSADATRLGYVAIAAAAAAIAGVFDVAMGALGGPRIASLLIPLLYLYAVYLHIAQVRVADLRQLMSRTIALSAMAAGLAGFFAAIRIWVGAELDLFVFNAFVASFALLAFFTPAHERLQAALDRRFIAEKLALERVLAPLAEELGQVRTLDELIRALLATLESTERIRAASIFLRDDAHFGFSQAGSIGLTPRKRVSLIRHPVWVEALERSPALLLEDLARAREAARSEDERSRLELLCRTLQDLDAQLVLALRSDDQLVGFWALADSSPGETFSTDEIRLLAALADRLAVGVENSRTFERIRARDRFASLGEMAAGLAHEVRNPLAAIRGALTAIEEAEPEDRVELQAVVVEETERLNRLVESFLDYARPSAHSRPVTELGAFVRECVRAVSHERRVDDVELRVHVQEGLPRVSADANQLERVVVNALHNAYEALDGKGSIRVSVTCDLDGDALGRFVDIRVEDDGPGMDAETLERAFVPFFTTKASGHGLGLALCERLMREQGGAIRLESQPGRGTVVCIRVPREQPAEGSTT